MKVVDLFCGAGGFSEGFRLAGHEIVLAVDNWPTALNTIKMNHTKSLNAKQMDIFKLSMLNDEEFFKCIPPDTEIIIGSPPCVSFSNSNHSGNVDKTHGIELIKSFFRIVARVKFQRNTKLKYWIMENVPNSEKYIQNNYTLKELGIDRFEINNIFEVKSGIENHSGIYHSNLYGVPSTRKRYFCGDFPKPRESNTNPLSLGQLIQTLEKRDKLEDPVWGIEINRNDITDLDYIYEVPKWKWEKAKRQKQDKGYMGKMSFPEKMENLARTVTAFDAMQSRESMIFPLKNKRNRYRVPTIREYATIMSFPLNYNFSGKSHSIKLKQVGNAVPPKLAYEFAKVMGGKNNKDYLNVERAPINGFKNLNGIRFPIKKEKNKNWKSIFTDHIPYLKVCNYRVVLDNRTSDFDKRKIKWIVTIHFGQGSDYKKFKLNTSSNIYKKIKLNEKDIAFINNLQIKVGTAINLQKNYCKTFEFRQTNNVIGPLELLSDIKTYISQTFSRPFQEYTKFEHNNYGKDYKIPYPILLGYKLLKEVLK